MALDAGRCDMTPLVNNGIDNGVVPYVDLCPARNSANNQARVTRLHLKAVSSADLHVKDSSLPS